MTFATSPFSVPVSPLTLNYDGAGRFGNECVHQLHRRMLAQNSLPKVELRYLPPYSPGFNL